MATLILTAVGTAVGGPIGGALGSILGQRLDQSLFAPKARQGPRLSELAVQVSTYGGPLPKLFGTMRVAGTVIWSTDLIETRSTSGGGKGQPKSVNYSYSASFAVTLSARPILGVGRIWADGKLLRGAAGDFKTPTAFRLHLGDEDQEADPLIASAVGTEEAPAYRGLAYAVFENFQLADYGNRIPSLSFEVAADEGDVTIGAIAEDLSGGLVRGGESPALGGYAASGDELRSEVAGLAELAALSLRDDGGRLWLTSPNAEAAAALMRAGESGRREIVRRGAGSVPADVSLAYHDPDRDYQTGLQRAVAEPGARPVERRALPAALNASAAKALADVRLAASRAGRTRAKLIYGWAAADLRPGAAVAIEGEAGLWAVRRSSLGPLKITLELERLPGGSVEAAAADPGQGGLQPDRAHGPTVLQLIDAPIGEPGGGKPLLFVAAAGEQPGWRRASLLASFDGGANWRDAGTTAAPAVTGVAETALAGGQPWLFDHMSAFEVTLRHDEMWLESADDDALSGGANLALLGDELLQFGRAEPLGERRFRLSCLLRGRRGTEWAAAGHIAGERFCLIEAAALAPVEAPAGSQGGELRVSATGVGDEEPVLAALTIAGASLLPPSPVALRTRLLGDGSVAIGWTRRSRGGWSWLSGADTPLGEESERYRLEISGPVSLRIAEVSEPSFLYDAAMQAADGAALPLAVEVRQLGDHGASRPATAMID